MTMTAVLKRWGPLMLGLLLVVVGVVIARQPVSYGWFGAPDGTVVQFPSEMLLLPASGAIVIATGVAVGWVGFRLGDRSRRSSEGV
jgi:uncharacterized membrane protein HdeD (DUF308 family)